MPASRVSYPTSLESPGTRNFCQHSAVDAIVPDRPECLNLLNKSLRLIASLRT
jgi:hypothetical protein